MKKLLTGVLTGACCLTAALGFSACSDTHKAVSSWTYDETNHWHVCKAKDCDEKFDFAEHTLVKDANGDYTCACGYGHKMEYLKALEASQALTYTFVVEDFTTTDTADDDDEETYIFHVEYAEGTVSYSEEKGLTIYATVEFNEKWVENPAPMRAKDNRNDVYQIAVKDGSAYFATGRMNENDGVKTPDFDELNYYDVDTFIGKAIENTLPSGMGTDDIETLADTFLPVITSWYETNLQPIVDKITPTAIETEEAIASFVDTIFEKVEKDGTKTLTFTTKQIGNFVETVCDKSVKDVVDTLLGEGTADKIVNYVFDDVLTTTPKALNEKLIAEGIDLGKLMDSIDELAGNYAKFAKMPETVNNLMSVIAYMNDGTSETQATLKNTAHWDVISNMETPISDAILAATDGAFKKDEARAQVDEVLKSNLLDLILFSEDSEMTAEEKTEVISNYKVMALGIIDQVSDTFNFTITYSDKGISAVELSFKDMEFDADSVSGKIKVGTDYQLVYDYTAIIEQGKESHAKFLGDMTVTNFETLSTLSDKETRVEGEKKVLTAWFTTDVYSYETWEEIYVNYDITLTFDKDGKLESIEVVGEDGTVYVDSTQGLKITDYYIRWERDTEENTLMSVDIYFGDFKIDMDYNVTQTATTLNSISCYINQD